MQKIVVRTPAKLNLTFDILGKRADGYHNIETIFQAITLEDELRIQVEDASAYQFELRCKNPGVQKLIPLDDSNLIGKAARIFFAKLGKANFKISVELDKKIPVGAGLAGGSSNAAGMLVGLNALFENVMTPEQLHGLASEIGSDVSFCLNGGTAIGKGRGELLEPIESNADLFYCIVKPRKLAVSTPWAFKTYAEFNGKRSKPDLPRVQEALLHGDIEEAIAGFGNVFEEMVFQNHPELARLRERILSLGAWACQMTGSGPTLFALVSSREMGHHIRRIILGDDDLGFVYGTEEILLEALPPIDFRLAESCEHGVRIMSMNEGGA